MDQLASTFSAAAFMAAKLPVRVVEASLAVVPVMSISCWMTWMALYMSAKLPRSYLTPEIFSASFSRRCISACVPP